MQFNALKQLEKDVQRTEKKLNEQKRLLNLLQSQCQTDRYSSQSQSRSRSGGRSSRLAPQPSPMKDRKRITGKENSIATTDVQEAIDSYLQQILDLHQKPTVRNAEAITKISSKLSHAIAEKPKSGEPSKQPCDEPSIGDLDEVLRNTEEAMRRAFLEHKKALEEITKVRQRAQKMPLSPMTEEILEQRERATKARQNLHNELERHLQISSHMSNWIESQSSDMPMSPPKYSPKYRSNSSSGSARRIGKGYFSVYHNGLNESDTFSVRTPSTANVFMSPTGIKYINDSSQMLHPKSPHKQQQTPTAVAAYGEGSPPGRKRMPPLSIDSSTDCDIQSSFSKPRTPPRKAPAFSDDHFRGNLLRTSSPPYQRDDTSVSLTFAHSHQYNHDHATTGTFSLAEHSRSAMSTPYPTAPPPPPQLNRGVPGRA